MVADIGMVSGFATLVAFAEGTTSIYFSSGGDVIGAGTYPAVAVGPDSLLAAG